MTNFTKVIFAILWATFSVFFAGYLVGVATQGLATSNSYLSSGIENSSPTVLLTLNALIYVVALGIMTVPFYKYFFAHKSKREVFGFIKKVTPGTLVLTVLAFGAYFLTSGIVTSLAGNYLPFVDIDQPQELGFEPTSEIAQLIIIFMMLVVVAPVAEELIFRGFLFKALREQLAFWPSAFIVSVLFGIAHGQWNVGIDTFVLSLFLCGLREYTGSLWACILLHAVKNLLAFTLLFLFPDILTSLPD